MKDKRQEDLGRGAEIILLPGAAKVSPIAHYLRVGDTGHNQLADLLAQGRLPAQQFVIDASQFRIQRELIASLKAIGAEIVLDTKAAELAEPGKYLGYAKFAPWARTNEGAMLVHEFYQRNHPDDIVAQMARFAVENEVSAVLHPGHLLRRGTADRWFDIDRLSCERLRLALDAAGGKHIGIDYSLLIQHTLLRDGATRSALISGLSSVPFDNLWIRTSGFGADGTPHGARGFINALAALHALDRPIVADHLGGLIGSAVVAFGGASGLAHGAGEKERFDINGWDKPPRVRSKDEPMGRTKRLPVFGLDKSLARDEFLALARARGGHRLLVCPDRDCCPHGIENMLSDPKAHFLRQRFSSLTRLEVIPDLKRPDHFLRTDMAIADQLGRQIRELKPVAKELVLKTGETQEGAAANLMTRINASARREEKLRVMLEDLNRVRGAETSRAKPAIRRIRDERMNKNQRSS